MSKDLQSQVKIKIQKSLMGRGLSHGMEVLNLGKRHIIHSGNQTKFWFDTWFKGGPLGGFFEGPLGFHETSYKVSDMLNASGNWEWQKLSFPVHGHVDNIIN